MNVDQALRVYTPSSVQIIISLPTVAAVTQTGWVEPDDNSETLASGYGICPLTAVNQTERVYLMRI